MLTWFSYRFPMVNTIFLWFSRGYHHHPMVFPWFSHGYHSFCPGFSQAFPTGFSHGFSTSLCKRGVRRHGPGRRWHRELHGAPSLRCLWWWRNPLWKPGLSIDGGSLNHEAKGIEPKGLVIKEFGWKNNIPYNSKYFQIIPNHSKWGGFHIVMEDPQSLEGRLDRRSMRILRRNGWSPPPCQESSKYTWFTQGGAPVQ